MSNHTSTLEQNLVYASLSVGVTTCLASSIMAIFNDAIWLTVVGIPLICLMASGFFSAKRIVKRLNEKSETMARIESGDFSDGKSSATGKCRRFLIIVFNFVSSVSSLGTAMSRQHEDLKKAAENTATEAASIEKASAVLGERIDSVVTIIHDAAHAVENIASGTEELRASADEVARNMEKAFSMTDDVAIALDRTKEAVDSTDKSVSTNLADAQALAQSMVAAQAKTQELREDMRNLRGSADSIGQILGVINDIADQTNLLALNAAIEAARAGDAGRGFAVVADEVRKLAEKTMSATKEVAESISGIQGTATKSVDSTEAVVEVIARGVELAKAQAVGFEGVSLTAATVKTQIEKVSRLMSEARGRLNSTSTAAAQQAAAVSDIAERIEGINGHLRKVEEHTGSVLEETVNLFKTAERVTRNACLASSATLQIGSSAHELGLICKSITGGLTGFNAGVPYFEIGMPKALHLAWRARLEAIIGGYIAMDPSQVADHHECDFGKWFDAERGGPLARLSDFGKVDNLHERVHRLAKEIVGLVTSGRGSDASRRMNEFESTRVDLFKSLDDLYANSFGMKKQKK